MEPQILFKMENCSEIPSKISTVYEGLLHSRHAQIREEIECAFKLCGQYLDQDFVKLFCLIDDFFARLWELYVGRTLVQSQNASCLVTTNGSGPDFHFKDFLGDKDLYIECVCPKKAASGKTTLIQNCSYKYLMEKEEQGFSSVSSGYDERIVARYGSSIRDKSKKFKEDYGYTEGHYRVLCVSGAELNLWKKELYNSESLSTEEDFSTCIMGSRECFFKKRGGTGYMDNPVEIQKGSGTLLRFGHHKDLSIFDAVVFSDNVPFLTRGLKNFDKIYYRTDTSKAFEALLNEILLQKIN